MELSKDAIEEFKDIYYQEFGERISDKEVQEMGVNLLSLFEIIYRPISKFGEQNSKDKNNKDPERV